MFWLYFLALIPVAIGGLLWFYGKEVNIQEWLIGAAIALLTSGCFHLYSVKSQIGDTQTISGFITESRQYSAWHEYYEYAVYRTETRTGTRTVSAGNGRYRTESYTYTVQVFDHWEPTTRWHNEHWKMFSNIDTTYSISKPKYIEMVTKLGGDIAVAGDRRTGEHNSKMIGGDPNDYVAINKTGWIEPVNKGDYFENRLKAARTVFAFQKITDKEALSLNIPLYPSHFDAFLSNRLMGTAPKFIDKFKWEQLNGELGPYKKINLICIGFDSPDSDLADKTLAYWKYPKKNDFIIFFGQNWSKVFSWSDSEIAKKNVETLFLNPNDPQLLEKIKTEIKQNYQIVNWHKFDYIRIYPKTSHVFWCFFILLVTQIGLYYYFHRNEYQKI
jgi:hypothetical protein